MLKHSPRWPKNVEISLKRGIFLGGLLFFLPILIVDLAIYFGVDPDVDSLGDGVSLVVLYCVILSIVLLMIQYVGGVKIHAMLFSRIPSLSDILMCCGIGFILSFFQFTASLRYGYRLEEPQFIWFMILGILLKSVLWPLVEEPIFRVVFFVTLYRWKNSRLIAYLGSTLFFLLFHFVSIIPLGMNQIGNFHIGFIVVFSLVAAYLYDKKGNILLCIFVHGMPNGADFFGAIVGYAIDSISNWG